MGYAQVPDHRRCLLRFGPRSSGLSSSLSRSSLLDKIILCLALFLLTLSATATAEQSPDISDVLDGQITFDTSSTNTTWEAGRYADIVLRVPLSSAGSPSQQNQLSAGDLNMFLSSYRSPTSIVLSARSALALVSQEHDEEQAILRYRWPVPVCLRSGRYSLQLQTRRLGGHQLLSAPISIAVPDETRRKSCSSELQAHLRSPGNIHQLRLRTKRASLLSARNTTIGAEREDAATIVAGGGAPITISPSSLPATIVVEPTGFHQSDPYSGTPGGGSYTWSPTYSTSYTSSENYTTPTSYMSSATSTASGNITSSVSENSTSVVVVTATATRTSVQTVTSVSTDVETMLTTVTGPDATAVFTTTQTLISTMMIVVPTTSTGAFLPVSGATHSATLPVPAFVTVCITTIFWLLCSTACCFV